MSSDNDDDITASQEEDEVEDDHYGDGYDSVIHGGVEENDGDDDYDNRDEEDNSGMIVDGEENGSKTYKNEVQEEYESSALTEDHMDTHIDQVGADNENEDDDEQQHSVSNKSMDSNLDKEDYEAPGAKEEVEEKLTRGQKSPPSSSRESSSSKKNKSSKNRSKNEDNRKTPVQSSSDNEKKAEKPVVVKKKRNGPKNVSRRGRAPAVSGLTIPFRTVKKAMKLDPDIPIVQNEAAIMTTLAAELFLKSLAKTSYKNAKNRGRNTIRYEDVAEARTKAASFSFLEPLLP